MTTVFAERIRQAAIQFPNQTISFAQVRDEAGQLKLRLQAIEIMKRFEGDVTYGYDPRGILFYTNLVAFKLSNVRFAYTKTAESVPNIVTLSVDFTGQGETRPFARFVARVDITKYTLPHYNIGGGAGRWRDYKIATSEANVFRQGTPSVYLQIGPVGREVVFPSTKTSVFDTNGLFMFKDISQLKDFPVPGDLRRMHVQYARDLFVFRYQPNSGGPDREFGLFLPNEPLADIGTSAQPPQANWYPFQPEVSFAKLQDTPAHEFQDTPADELQETPAQEVQAEEEEATV